MLGHTRRDRDRIIKLLVKGGFGRTYLAKDLDLQQTQVGSKNQIV